MNSNKTNLDTANLIELSRMVETGFFNLPHEIVSLKRDEVLYHQGDNVEKIGFVLEGIMKCSTYTNNGDELNPHYFYEGEIFPEYLLFSGERQYIYTLVVEKAAKLLLIDFQEILSLVEQDKEWSHLILRYMAKRGLSSEKWKLCNCYGSLRSRIAYMLLEIYHANENDWIDLRDNQRIISTKLQISRTAYNQEIMKLKDEGIIESNRSKIKVLNKRRLMGYM